VFDLEIHSYKLEYKIYFEPCNIVVCSGMFTICKSFHSLAAMHMSAHRFCHLPVAVSTVLSVQQNAPYIIWFAKFESFVTVQCNLQHTYELLNAGGVYNLFKETGNT
jgi:hypothetical protein